MDALLQSRAQELATEFASQATTVEELNELLRLMMKSGPGADARHGDGRPFGPAAGGCCGFVCRRLPSSSVRRTAAMAAARRRCKAIWAR